MQLASAKASNGKFLRQYTVEPQIVDRRQELTLSQIAATAEYDERARLRPRLFEAHCKRIMRDCVKHSS